MNNNITIRFATEEDIPLILSFIKELAKYEKLLDQVTATEQKLRETLFNNKKYAEVIIASINNKVAGYALFFHTFSSFLSKPGLYLEDLYIKPEFRKQKIATSILIYLANLAVDRGCDRFEWACLDWNQPAIDFYTSMGAIAMDEWTVYRVNGNNLKSLANKQTQLV
ncbi:MAG: GNAT family N-acetyltransferase [Neisseriaceae bacterium]|jgi:GNAT superfamily N-acetyltransferase